MYDWVQNSLGRSSAEIEKWSTIISDQKWFEDPVIQESLIEYCCTKYETLRYVPFAALANRILDLARGNLPGVPKENSYPIDDICFVDNSKYEVEKILQHRICGKTTQYLVRWEGFGREDDTWEPEKNLEHAKAKINEYKKLGLAPVRIIETQENIEDELDY